MASPFLGFAGYAAAALAFALLALFLAMRRHRAAVSPMLRAALIAQIAWAATMSAAAIGQVVAVALAPLLEALRSLLWILFLIGLANVRPAAEASGVPSAGLGPPTDNEVSRASRRGVVIAVVLATASAGSELIAAGPGMVFAARTLNAVFGLVCLEQVYRNAADGRRWAAKYLALALLALFGFDLVMYSDAMLFTRMNEAWWTVRGFANALLVPLLAVSAARNPQWKLDIGVSRQAVFHSAALTLAGGYLILVSAGGYYVRWFGGEWGAVAQALIVFAALLGLAMVAVSGTMRARLRVFVAKHFFSYRFDYRNEWLRLTRLLASGSPQDLPAQAIEGLGQPVESRSGAIWLESEGSYRFETGIAWRGERASIDADAPLIHLLREHEWIVDVDELRDDTENAPNADGRPRDGASLQQGLVLPDAIAKHENSWLIVPLLLERELIGFVVLDRPLAPQVFDWETRDLLKAAARQIASHIGVQRTLEKLITAQQFESFNRMSAFVVHDLKNLVAQLGLMTKNAQRHRDNPEFQADMLATVENVMERMRGLLLQLRAGTRPVEHPAPVRLTEVLQAAVQSRRGLRPEPTIRIDGELADDPDASAVAHRDRLERVIGHLLQNAAEACGPDGRVDLRLRRDGDQATIEVEDNGRGMSETFIRDKLFAPFQSTKAHGMGIGAFESREYLREIGGSLEVRSKEGAGTMFRIRLPLAMGVRGEMNG